MLATPIFCSPAKAGVHHLPSRYVADGDGKTIARVMDPRFRGGTQGWWIESMYNLLPTLSVIEASSFVASPTAGLYLAQFGAEVIRVDGDYDTAVAECRTQAAARDWTWGAASVPTG